MTRAAAVTALWAWLLAYAACVPTMNAHVQDRRVRLTWDPIAVPADATDVRYEVEIHEADQGLPVARVRSLTVLGDLACEVAHLPAGVYVWSVRARYRRLDREWVTRWQASGARSGAAVVPQRGFRPLTIR